MKYKIGDKVKIRSDLEVDKEYGKYNFSEEMDRYKGKTLEIIYVDETYYEMQDDFECHFWTDEMIEGKVEDMLGFAGWAIFKKIANKEIKEGTIITDGEHSYIFDGRNFKDESLHTFLTDRYTDDKLATSFFKIKEEESKEQKQINIQDIGEFEEIRDISTWSNKTLSENQRLIIIKINALIRALKQLDDNKADKGDYDVYIEYNCDGVETSKIHLK